MDIFRLMASLGLDKTEYDEGLENARASADGVGSKISGAFKTAAAATAAAVGVAATAVGALAKEAVSAYSNYEQLVGGIETLFGAQGLTLDEYAESVGKSVDEVKDKYNTLMEAQETALANANAAYKSAGMNVNDYMETITSFAASLKQSTEDEVEAAQVADLAIQDMSDNASKMGTDMESIQNAYQGFAKQNYTMLDNLKLGYGGTKTEMERLLAKAEELSGQEYDISNLSDVYNAIHVIQENLGITGTTAKEAMYTIEGSANMTKAAWENVIVAIGKGEGLQEALSNLSESIFGDGSEGAGLLNNVIPRIQTVFDSIGTMVTEMAPMISEQLPAVVSAILPGLLQSAVSLIGAVASALPGLLEALWTTLKATVASGISTAMDAIPEALNALSAGFDVALSLIESIADGIAENLPTLLEQALPLLVSFTDALREGAGELIPAGLDLIISLAQGLMDGLPTLIANVPLIVSNIANIINDNAPLVLAAGFSLIATLVTGLIKAIPSLVANMPKIINAIADTLMAFQWLNLGASIMKSVQSGIVSLASSIKSAVSNIATNAKAQFTNIQWGSVGKSIMSLFKSGISSMRSAVVSVAKGIGSAIKNAFLSINLVSVGKNLISGLWNGISSKIAWVKSKVASAVNSIKKVFTGKNGFDEASPSKWAKKVFEYVLSGGVQGLEKGLPGLLDSAGTVTSAVKDSLTMEPASYSVTADGLASEVSGDSVLTDFSEAFTEVIASETNRIMAILAQYLPECANTQLVMDTGALVGQITPSIDARLGTLAARKARTN